MRKNLDVCVFAAVFQICLAVTCFAASELQDKKSTKSMKLEKAIDEYTQAKADLRDADIINFNAGVAFYQKENFKQAAEAFTQALITDNLDLEAIAIYNIANSKYRQASVQESTNLSAAIDLCRESLDYYKRAIELNQNDEAAKRNYELTQKKLELLLEQMKQQHGQNQESDSKDKPDSEQQDGATQDKGAESESEPADSQQQQQLSEHPEQPGQGAAEYEVSGEMSKEEAHLLLEAYGTEEESLKQEEKKEIKARSSNVLKNW